MFPKVELDGARFSEVVDGGSHTVPSEVNRVRICAEMFGNIVAEVKE